MNFINGVAWRQTGFRLEVQKITGKSDRFLKVNDLNSEVSIKTVLTRWECAQLGALLLWRAVFAKTSAQDARQRKGSAK